MECVVEEGFHCREMEQLKSEKLELCLGELEALKFLHDFQMLEIIEPPPKVY